MGCCVGWYQTELFEPPKACLSEYIWPFVIYATVILTIFFGSLQWPVRSREWQVGEERFLSLVQIAITQILQQLSSKRLGRVKVWSKGIWCDPGIVFDVKSTVPRQETRSLFVRLGFPAIVVGSAQLSVSWLLGRVETLHTGSNENERSKPL